MNNHNPTQDRSLEPDERSVADNGAGPRKEFPIEEEIKAWLVSNIAAIIEIDPELIDVQKPLENYGIDSMQAMNLSGDMQEWLGCQLSPTVVWDYPTIELLARHLIQDKRSSLPSPAPHHRARS